MSSNIYEIKSAIGYDDQIRDKKRATIFFLGLTTLCGLFAAANLDPERVNSLLNTAFQTTNAYLPEGFGNEQVGIYSAAAGGVAFAKALAKNEGRRAMKSLIKSIERYETIRDAADNNTSAK